nr:MAG TPA: hypothetical protein [Caudoviricetes sp.]DAN23236.1 MAG TPA_asm: hypothetical protein [Bacteriophage sp.]
MNLLIRLWEQLVMQLIILQIKQAYLIFHQMSSLLKLEMVMHYLIFLYMDKPQNLACMDLADMEVSLGSRNYRA